MSILLVCSGSSFAAAINQAAPLLLKVSAVELKDEGGSLESSGAPALSLEPLQLPLSLPGNRLTLTARLGNPADRAILLKTEIRMAQGKGRFSVTLKTGENHFDLFVVDAKGHVRKYDLEVEIGDGKDPSDSVRGYFLFGPVFYSHTVTRGGSATSVAGSQSAPAAGVRAIYRRRLLQSITDVIPGKPRIFGDVSGTVTKTLSGDTYAQGMPIWGDARATLELAASESFRFEIGAGMSYFSPMTSQSIPGDINSFIGFLASARLGFSLSPKLMTLAGVNYAFPVTSIDDTSTLTNQPLEAFLSLGYKVGQTSTLELRGKYYKLTTSGTVQNAGAFSREETFLGPELLYSLSY